MPILWSLKVPERGNAITTQPGHYILFLIPPKNPYSNPATQKNTCQIFVPKKIPESKISNPKISFDHPRQLKSWVPPLGIRSITTSIFSANLCIFPLIILFYMEDWAFCQGPKLERALFKFKTLNNLPFCYLFRIPRDL